MSKAGGSTKTIALVGMILSGILLGYAWQRIADSGLFQFRRIVFTCLISVGSYLAAFWLVEWRLGTRRASGWLLAAIVGSLLSAFNIKVVKFLIVNAQDPYSPSVTEQIYQIGVGFLSLAVVYVIVTIIVISTIQFVARQLSRLFPS